MNELLTFILFIVAVSFLVGCIIACLVAWVAARYWLADLREDRALTVLSREAVRLRVADEPVADLDAWRGRAS